ncbi:hypothetical protein CEXT_736071 [Caerostris extrusa]|uniref:Uncharacterized protein n=1 Tax=Caerostris extrusa TaxID=172846 RepID=A0AAV4TMB3_CAEEX|nr:hypothetical protein CEXT_736071 [Caerostris extrusa]
MHGGGGVFKRPGNCVCDCNKELQKEEGGAKVQEVLYIWCLGHSLDTLFTNETERKAMTEAQRKKDNEGKIVEISRWLNIQVNVSSHEEHLEE